MADASENNGYYLNIEGYYDKVHRTTWARHTAGLLAGGTLGAAYGAVVGVAAAFVPYILGAMGVTGAAGAFAAGLPSMAAIGASVALFAAVTAGIGILFTSEVATTAASSAVGMEEKERREKMEELHNKSASQVCTECEVEGAIVREDLKREDEGKKGPPMFSWRVAAITAPVLAAFGGLIAMSPHTAATMFNHAEGFSGLSGPAAVAGSASVFGMFGACLGLKSSLLTNKLTNFYYDVVTERFFGNVPQQEVEKTPAIEVSRPVEVAMDHPARSKPFAADRMKFSLQSILDQEEAAKSGPVINR